MSKTTENQYSNFSAPVLEAALDTAYQLLSDGLITDVESHLARIDQMTSALEARQKTDYCSHGVHLYQDHSPACWQCEAQ